MASTATPSRKSLRSNAFVLIAMLLATMWAVEAVDSVILGDRLQRNGIRPRMFDEIDGVGWAPFLHSGWRHLISNTVPFAVLGGLTAVRGTRRWAIVTIVVVIVGGVLTWTFGESNSNHIGASGVVFGYFGALLGAAFFERRAATVAPAAVAILLYSGILAGLVPQQGISWEGHLFGLVGGLCASKLVAQPRKSHWDDVDPSELEFGDTFG